MFDQKFIKNMEFAMSKDETVKFPALLRVVKSLTTSGENKSERDLEKKRLEYEFNEQDQLLNKLVEESDEEPESDSEECTESGSDDEEKDSWFERTVLNSDYDVRKKYKETLRSLGWVKACAVGVPNEEHDELHLLIICKKGEVPRMAQLKKCLGVEIVSYVEFMAEITDLSGENKSERDLEKKRLEYEFNEQDQLLNKLVEESEEEPESDSEECTDSGSDDEEKDSWFERTVLNSDYDVRKKYKEALRSLGWVKACAVGVPNEEHDELHLLIICKKGEVPRMAQLKKCLGVEIVSYVEFIAEITDFRFDRA